MTAETFATLKLHCLEPDADAAAALTGETAPEQEGVFAHAPQDVLSKMPGITQKNIRHVMTTVTDLSSLAKMGLKAMEDMLGKVSGKLLFDFFHNRASPSV